MSKPTDTHVQAAKRLILAAQASCASGSAEAQEAAARHMSGAIYRAFSPVIGTAGIGALFARSVKLTRANFLASVQSLWTPMATGICQNTRAIAWAN